MAVRSDYLSAVVLAAMALSGCDKFSSSGGGSQTQASGGEQGAAPTASAIAKTLSAGNYDDAVRDARAAIATDPQNPELLLLLARAQARLQNVGDAVKSLQASFDAGFHDPRGALNNPDFDGIRTNPIFAEFVSRYQRRQAAASRPAPSAPGSTIRAGDVSITESHNGHSRIRAGDVTIED